MDNSETVTVITGSGLELTLTKTRHDSTGVVYRIDVPFEFIPFNAPAGYPLGIFTQRRFGVRYL